MFVFYYLTQVSTLKSRRKKKKEVSFLKSQRTTFKSKIFKYFYIIIVRKRSGYQFVISDDGMFL